MCFLVLQETFNETRPGAVGDTYKGTRQEKANGILTSKGRPVETFCDQAKWGKAQHTENTAHARGEEEALSRFPWQLTHVGWIFKAYRILSAIEMHPTQCYFQVRSSPGQCGIVYVQLCNPDRSPLQGKVAEHHAESAESGA
ncbi:hypothetical protein Y1Q_0007220 [Alligator mississippiensis]|uniref:Uncharacterized protein n=1 Tax=Alligator mississippiensis TaxID=8496 RepID=A0A151N631_ALLMI|nr:hypothetical protein Y1Q_0007220 [Alligator mississippiensis]